MSDLETAREHKTTAEYAAENQNNKAAAEYYFKAAELFGNAEETFWEKYCEGMGWYHRSVTIDDDTLESCHEKALCSSNAVKALNATMGHVCDM